MIDESEIPRCPLCGDEYVMETTDGLVKAIESAESGEPCGIVVDVSKPCQCGRTKILVYLDTEAREFWTRTLDVVTGVN